MVKNSPANVGALKRCRFRPWVRKIPWRRAWQPTPVFLPRESLGLRNLAYYSPWGHKELDNINFTVMGKGSSVTFWKQESKLGQDQLTAKLFG